MENKNLIKMLAQQAKNRLKGKPTNIRNFRVITNDNCEIKTIVTDNKDEELYKKVKSSIEKCCFNPIAMLVDSDVYKNLNAEQKQRYMFKLADKYRQLKTRYESEKIKEMCL